MAFPVLHHPPIPLHPVPLPTGPGSVCVMGVGTEYLSPGQSDSAQLNSFTAFEQLMSSDHG